MFSFLRRCFMLPAPSPIADANGDLQNGIIGAIF
jgi:hypothetical protein